MIITRDGKQVDKITLDRAEWCYFITKRGAKYVVTNANHKMVVTKPLEIARLKPTKEIRQANITII